MDLTSQLLDPPLVERLNQLRGGLHARSIVQGAGAGPYRAPGSGASVEFRQHRFYVPGDDPRRLDWRILARSDRPYVREAEEETNLRCMLLLDRSGSMSYGGKLTYAARLAAALAYIMLGIGESVGCAAAANDVEHWLAPHRGSQQLARMLAALGSLDARERIDLPRLARQATERLERRALVVLISDFFAPPAAIAPALARLRHGRHEVVALQVLHRDEINFSFKQSIRLRGLEGEPSRLCDPALARKIYLENFHRHRTQLRALCVSQRVDLAELITDQPVAEALASWLRARDRAMPQARVRS